MNPQSSFESPLADIMERFVVHKQMQGLDYTDPAYRLTFFDRLVEQVIVFLVSPFRVGVVFFV